jgi:hypothetical protein
MKLIIAGCVFWMVQVVAVAYVFSNPGIVFIALGLFFCALALGAKIQERFLTSGR